MVRRSGTTSRGTALILVYLCKCLFWVVFFEQVQVSLNYFVRPFRKIENRYFYNFLKSSHFAIIWAFWVTNLGSNTLQERKIIYFRNNLSAKNIEKSTWTMSLFVFMDSKNLICDRNKKISAVPLHVALERRTKRCSPEISARLSLLDQRF